jgi:hypothetical protein
MMKYSPRKLILSSLILIAVFSLFSCRKKDQVDTNPSVRLRFSTDTVFFDTVFSTVGSVTQQLMVYNDNSSKIVISSIRLASGGTTNFRLNIDGLAENSASDIEIPAKDSLYIFVRITVDPTNQNNPMIISDSLLFTTNGNLQKVNLVAWGWDAHFYKEKNLEGNITFDSLKPHVIYGYLRVDTASILTIQQGAKIYFHKDAYLAVSSQSSLNVQGVLGHPVRFQGDRLDPFYRDLPGQWGGIYLEKGSVNNVVNYAVIKNGISGIEVDSASSPSVPVLQLDNTIIQNMSSTGLYAYSSFIRSTNTVIGDCGTEAIALIFGGNYDFRQLTIGNYWTSSVRLDPSLYINNYTYDSLGVKHVNPLEKAYFGNIILYGGEENELGLSADASAAFNYMFDHCLLKTTLGTGDPSHYTNCLVNQDPLFINTLLFDYKLDTLSPAIKQGIPMGVDFDINGIYRGATPDLGAYQYVNQ